MPVSTAVLDPGHPKGHQIQSLASGTLVWGGRWRGHRQLWGDKGHVKEWRKKTGDHEKGELGWGGQGTSLKSDTLQSQGKRWGMKGGFLDTDRQGDV